MCKFMIKFKRAVDKKVEAVGWKTKRRQRSCELIAAEEAEKAKRIWTGRQRSRRNISSASKLLHGGPFSVAMGALYVGPSSLKWEAKRPRFSHFLLPP